MNLEQINRGSAAAIGFLLVSVIFVALAVGLKSHTFRPPLDADRGVERSKALAEIRAIEEASLATTAVIDVQHGVVRLPIEDAIQLAAEKWQNPSAARADLNSRAEKAAAELPKAPDKPSAFE